MKEIWKFQLLVCDGPQEITIPKGSEIVAIAGQGGRPTMWVKVDPLREAEPRNFSVIGTGQAFGNTCGYIGTALCDPFVWHVLEHWYKPVGSN